jgi:HSP20 family molecular chaperone IbpA
MADKKDVTSRESAAVQQEPESVLRPPVDISEDAEGITLLADMPGVNSDRLDIHVDNDTLLIDGEAKLDMPEGMEPLYADIRSTHYRRSFALSSELDTAGIDASLTNGVLSVRIPRRAEVKPRRIKVNVR